MPKINRYVDISEIDREAKKDYIDRHSPFIHCASEAAAGERFEVTVKVGDAYEHPDDMDHYISTVTLYNKEDKLAEACLSNVIHDGTEIRVTQQIKPNVYGNRPIYADEHETSTKIESEVEALRAMVRS